MDVFLFFVYIAVGYWAVGVVLYENKIIIHQVGDLFFRKLVWGIIFGWFFIPVAIIKRLSQRK